MVYEFKFPDVGEGIHEGTLVKWIKKEGEQVEADENIAEVETDKAVVEIPSPKKGTLLKLYHKEGETITVGEILAVIGEKGESIPEIKAEKEHYTGSIVGFVPDEAEDLDKEKKKTSTSSSTVSVAAMPSARKLAKEKGMDLANVKGTGPNGLITEDDVNNSAKHQVDHEAHGETERIPMKGIRKITAEKMSHVAQTYALVTHHEHVDVSPLSDLRNKEKEEAKKQGVHLTYLAYIIKATVESLKKHPYVASSLDGNDIVLKKYYNIGVAIDTPDGLVVPVIKDADKKSLFELAKSITEFVEKAKSKKLSLDDMKGGVFTITNIGVIGSTYFTPIPNGPESCIFGTGRIEERPRVYEGQVAVRKIMPISFTYDHRVMDGAEAARFMEEIRQMLENPDKIPK
ncbi:2-oxo acid dehydrogenase subunit E2 [Candidatus Woesearchaeota archaeon]|nr:2-oxo acid dehydrogenase subunit E2 [Candidatus Woesearchaeota archaeon]